MNKKNPFGTLSKQTGKVKKGVGEFLAFAVKGNAIDLAVGIIIGTAFNKIVSSLVGDVFLPALSAIIGRVNFADLQWTLPTTAGDGSPIVLQYGSLIQSVVDFLIIALCVFFIVKLMQRLRNRADTEKALRESEEKAEQQKLQSEEFNQTELLLCDIRDLLKEKLANGCLESTQPEAPGGQPDGIV